MKQALQDIFLREIVSNANDALDKLKYLTVSDDNYKNVKFDPRIDISFDEKANTLTVKDSGIGMSEEDFQKDVPRLMKLFGIQHMSELEERIAELL